MHIVVALLLQIGRFAEKFTKKDATCTEDGKKVYSTTVSFNGKDYKDSYEEKAANALGHTYKAVWDWKENPADGATLSLTCSRGDDTKTYEVKAGTSTVDASCTSAGKHIYTVEYGEYTDKKEEPFEEALGHAYEAKWTWAKNLEDPAALILTCSRCNDTQTFSVPVSTSTSKNATCTAAGEKTHSVFYTYNGVTYTDEKKSETAPLGHTYGQKDNSNVTFTFSEDGKTATAVVACVRPGCDYTDTADAVVTSKVTKPATCTEMGETTYTASYPGAADAVMTRTDVEMVPHNFDGAQPIEWDWSGLHTSATVEVTLACQNGNPDCTAVTTDVTGEIRSEVTEPATCTKAGKMTYTAEYNGAKDTHVEEIPMVPHTYTGEPTWTWNDNYTSAEASFQCDNCDHIAPQSDCLYYAIEKVSVAPTCTEDGSNTYTATVIFNGKTYTDTQVETLEKLGHSFTDYRYDNNATCEGDGSQTATCDRCDATDTKSVPGSAACTLHEVDNAKVCPICGKVNGTVKLNKVSAAADDSASVYSAQLIVRVGTLPNGRKIITVTFLNAEGQAITLYDAQKIRVSLAALNAQLGETGAQSFAHTLTSLNTANGEKSNVGFAVENGTLIFDAPFQSSTACVLLVD